MGKRAARARRAAASSSAGRGGAGAGSFFSRHGADKDGGRHVALNLEAACDGHILVDGHNTVDCRPGGREGGRECRSPQQGRRAPQALVPAAAPAARHSQCAGPLVLRASVQMLEVAARRGGRRCGAGVCWLAGRAAGTAAWAAAAAGALTPPRRPGAPTPAGSTPTDGIGFDAGVGLKEAHRLGAAQGGGSGDHQVGPDAGRAHSHVAVDCTPRAGRAAGGKRQMVVWVARQRRHPSTSTAAWCARATRQLSTQHLSQPGTHAGRRWRPQGSSWRCCR